MTVSPSTMAQASCAPCSIRESRYSPDAFISFKNNKCSGGHGISIGSISSGKSVTDVTISGNTVTDSMYGFR